MWSRRTAIFSVLAAPFFLGGCGFKPLYGSVDRKLENALAGIEVGPIPDRLGRDVRNALIKDLRQPAAGSQSLRYRLEVGLTQTVQGVAIQDDDSITRFNFKLIADFRLTRKSDDGMIVQDKVQTVAAYNVVDSEYATLIARRDVEERAAREIAEKIRVRLSLILAEQPAA